MANIYETLQDKFIEIRYLHSEGCFDEMRFLIAKNHIEEIQTKLKETPLLTECIDVLRRLFKENERQKIFDFADLIHNMPEIYLGKRNVKSFKREIQIFNKKYKTKYFKEYIKLFSPQRV